MTPEEKIEALRKWANKNDEPDFGQWAAGYHKALTEVRDIIDPPKPKWREIADQWSWTALHIPTEQDALASVLYSLGGICAGKVDADWLGKIIAVCEAQVGDGWQADPERVHPGFWGVAWLLVPLSHEPPDWAVVGDRAAAWLRSLKDEKLGTRTDAKYEHTLDPHCPVCFGVCAGSNRDGAA